MFKTTVFIEVKERMVMIFMNMGTIEDWEG